MILWRMETKKKMILMTRSRPHLSPCLLEGVVVEVPSVQVEEVVEEQVEDVEAWAASSEHEVEEEVEEGSPALHEVQCQPTSPRSRPTEPGTGQQAAGAGHRRHGAFLSIMLENLFPQAADPSVFAVPSAGVSGDVRASISMR